MYECKSCGATWTKSDGNVCPYCHRHAIIENPPINPPVATVSSKNNINIIKIVAIVTICLFVSGVFLSVSAILKRNLKINEYSSRNNFISNVNNSSRTESEVFYNSADDKKENLEYQREKGIYVAGTYEVGVDIPEGEYIVMSESNHPTDIFPFGIYTSESCSDESKLSFDWFENHTIVVVEAGQFVDFAWSTMYDLQKNNISLDPFSSSGMFKVGEHMDSGSYTIVVDEGQYYPNCTIYSSLNSISPIVKQKYSYEDFIDGKLSDITLSDGEYLCLNYCHIEK